jgi:transcriptional antiterminator
VLADLFDVSRRTIGNAVTWVRPLLEQDGYTITHSGDDLAQLIERLSRATLPHPSKS